MLKKKKTDEDPVVAAARKRVRARKKFFKHLRAYLIVNTAMSMLLLWDEGNIKDWIPIWIFWGMGLAFHYFKTFGFLGIGQLDEEWEEIELQKELHRQGIDEPEDWLDLNTPPTSKEEPVQEKKYREEDLL